MSFSRRAFLKLGSAGAAAIGGSGIAAAQERPDNKEIFTLEDLGFTEECFQVRREPIRWPNNARVALTWSVDHEDYNDAASVWQVHYHTYGGKAGIWRVLETAAKHGVKLSVFANGLTAQRYPEGMRALQREGHEIIAHGWANNWQLHMVKPEEEHRVIKRTIDTIGQVISAPIYGWMGPGWRTTRRTMEYISQEGCTFSGDYPIDDLPFTLTLANGKKMVVIPYIRESNDIRIHAFHRQSPSVWLDCFKDHWDVLYRESEKFPLMMNADVHSWAYGRPLGKQVLEEAIRYARGFSDVWWCTRKEIVDWWIQQDYA
jgi:peptidoglycan/xylan/chitin deacetylase (PgdA/CDA1 family)